MVDAKNHLDSLLPRIVALENSVGNRAFGFPRLFCPSQVPHEMGSPRVLGRFKIGSKISRVALIRGTVILHPPGASPVRQFTVYVDVMLLFIN